jgi:hypothetical protein
MWMSRLVASAPAIRVLQIQQHSRRDMHSIERLLRNGVARISRWIGKNCKIVLLSLKILIHSTSRNTYLGVSALLWAFVSSIATMLDSRPRLTSFIFGCFDVLVGIGGDMNLSRLLLSIHCLFRKWQLPFGQTLPTRLVFPYHPAHSPIPFS